MTSKRPLRSIWTAWVDRLLPLAGALLVVLCWWVLHVIGWLPHSLVPSPFVTGKRLLWLFSAEGRIHEDLQQSALRMAMGYFPAAILGTILGLIFGSVRRLHRLFSFVLDFARSTPITATYPFWIVFCGLGNVSKSAMVFAATVPTVILATIYGVQHSSPIRSEMAGLFRASGWQIFWQVRFFDALPHIVVGLRVAISYALIVSIVVELFMGTQRGLGQRIFEAYQAYQMADLFALVLLIGTLGWGLNQLFVLAEQRIFHWAGK